MKAGECVCDISVRVCVSVPGQLFLLTAPHVRALRCYVASLGISSMAARSNGAPGRTGGGRGGGCVVVLVVVIKHYRQVERARGRLRIALISPPPLLLTAGV